MSKCLRDIADVHYGKSPTDVLTEDSPIPIIGTGGIYGRASRAMYNGPAVIVPRKGSLGNPQYVGEPCWPVDTTYAVIPKTGVDAKWLYYSLAAFDLTKLNEATGVPSIGRDWLYKVPVGSEEYGEQRRIAEILSTVDEAIEQTEALIAKYQQIKAGLMHDLFTRGVTPDGRLRPTRVEAPHLYKESPLGWIPKEWEVVRLDMVSEVDRGKFTVRPRNDPRFYGGQYPFIQTGDVAFAGGRTLKSYAQSLNELGLSVSKLFPPGTIMVTIAANIADTCILGMPMCAPDSLVGVQPKTREDARFIELSIRRRKSWLESRAPQTAQRNINLEDLRPLIIPWPKGWERSRISEIYETQDSAIRACEEQLAKLQKEKQGLMHDLLSGRVRVDG
ncbi:MAG: restriction endonuclease subunit S [Nitrospiraceae bacterium]